MSSSKNKGLFGSDRVEECLEKESVTSFDAFRMCVLGKDMEEKPQPQDTTTTVSASVVDGKPVVTTSTGPSASINILKKVRRS